jgi:hypothetical protein
VDNGVFINVRKLAALDLALHGARFVLIEFGLAVVWLGALGLTLIVRGTAAGYPAPPWMLVVGGYLTLIGLNYVPLLLYAAVIAYRGSARTEAAHELANKGHYSRKYGLQQLFLLLPLVIPMLAIWQVARRHAPK